MVSVTHDLHYSCRCIVFCSTFNLLSQNRCGIIFIITTAVLGFMFLPKMIQKRASARGSATSGEPSRDTAQATRSAGITSRFSSNNADPVVNTRASNVEQEEEVKGEKMSKTDESLPTEEVTSGEKVGNDSEVKV